MKLSLERPIAFLDIEATGVIVGKDRIIDLAMIKVHPDGQEEKHYWRVNPEMPISLEATAVHGITDKDVQGKPAFRDVAKEIAMVLKDCDLGGFGIVRFDVPMLSAEFIRAGVEFPVTEKRLVDALVIFHQKERRDLRAAVKFYLRKDFTNAHDAMADTDASLRVFQAQLDRYPDLPFDVDGIDLLCNPRDPNWIDQAGKLVWVGEDAAINFGKYTGNPLRELIRDDPGYLDWILKKDFPEDIKSVVRDARAGRFLTRPSSNNSNDDELPF